MSCPYYLIYTGDDWNGRGKITIVQGTVRYLMMEKPGASILTCVVLSALTLGVFGLEQSSGPESAVRKYLSSLSRNDVPGVQALITVPVDSNASLFLIQALQPIASNPYRVTAKQREGNIALVKTDHEASVLTANGQQPVVVSFFWVLSRERGVWRIDPIGTLRYRQRSDSGRL
ncbi:MAG: hypothetical protein JNK63_00420 [Chthonomonas sp.]|nr:hypothetical protein [Chthonomonas sp.]